MQFRYINLIFRHIFSSVYKGHEVYHGGGSLLELIILYMRDSNKLSLF